MHTCPAPHCEAKVRDDMLACRHDWYRLPRGLRNRILDAWAGGAGSGTAEHALLVAEALEWYRANAGS